MHQHVLSPKRPSIFTEFKSFQLIVHIIVWMTCVCTHTHIWILSPWRGTPSRCRWRRHPLGMESWECWTCSGGQSTMVGPPPWGLGKVLTTPYHKKINMLWHVLQSLVLGQLLHFIWPVLLDTTSHCCSNLPLLRLHAL